MRIESVAGVADDGDADALKRRKLTDAAQQFEGMLLEQMLKPMREGGDWGEESGGGSQTMASFGTEAVAKAISKAGGLGIARQVVRQVMHEMSAGTKKS